jgi:hypothetical protein
MPPAAPIPLAQAKHDTGDALIWALVLIVFVVGLFAVVVLYRRWMNRDDSTTGAGFTIGDLRRLHKEGKMTTEEFETAKGILIGSMKAAEIRDAQKPKQGPRTDPPGFDVLPPGK